MTAATASELIRLLQQDSNFIPLQTRDSFDETTTPAQRAARADEQAPQLLLSIHGNSAANGSTASGFECYPAVPGRTWHQESFYFAQLLAKGMQAAGASLRGRGESDTFIIWKTIRSNWWKAPTPRCVQSEALRCWKM